MAESSVEVVLALNRCLFICAPNVAITLFGSKDYGTENRVWFWMVPPTLWGLFYFVRGSPTIFTSIYHIETWNPHRGYFDDMIQYVKVSLQFAKYVFLSKIYIDSTNLKCLLDIRCLLPAHCPLFMAHLR